MEGIGHILQKFEKTKFGVYKSQMEEKNMKFSEKINKKVSSKKGVKPHRANFQLNS